MRGLGWSEDEQLLVVTEDGMVRCYYDLQGDFTQFSLGNVSFMNTRARQVDTDQRSFRALKNMA